MAVTPGMVEECTVALAINKPWITSPTRHTVHQVMARLIARVCFSVVVVASEEWL